METTDLAQSVFRWFLGSARGPSAPFGGPPNGFKWATLAARIVSCAVPFGTAKVFGQRPKTARQRRALPRRSKAHAIFLRNCNAQRMNSKFDIRMRTTRFGQYSKKLAPRKMIARMSAMKYVVGKSAPSA
jgi:hypothetical protein